MLDIDPYFDDTRKMKLNAASERLAALGHETRLAIFRLLVQAGDTGVNAGLIGKKLDIRSPANS